VAHRGDGGRGIGARRSGTRYRGKAGQPLAITVQRAGGTLTLNTTVHTSARIRASRSGAPLIPRRSRPRSGRAWRRGYNRIMGKVSVRFFARVRPSWPAAVRRRSTGNAGHGCRRNSRASVIVFPGTRVMPPRPLAALNRRQVKLDTPVSDGMRWPLLPPLSGG